VKLAEWPVFQAKPGRLRNDSGLSEAALEQASEKIAKIAIFRVDKPRRVPIRTSPKLKR
jgi:hypothetical protein